MDELVVRTEIKARESLLGVAKAAEELSVADPTNEDGLERIASMLLPSGCVLKDLEWDFKVDENTKENIYLDQGKRWVGPSCGGGSG